MKSKKTKTKIRKQVTKCQWKKDKSETTKIGPPTRWRRRKKLNLGEEQLLPLAKTTTTTTLHYFVFVVAVAVVVFLDIYIYTYTHFSSNIQLRRESKREKNEREIFQVIPFLLSSLLLFCSFHFTTHTNKHQYLRTKTTTATTAAAMKYFRIIATKQSSRDAKKI